MQVDLSRPSTAKSTQSVLSRTAAGVRFSQPNSGSRPPTHSSNRLISAVRPVSQGQTLQPSVSAPRLNTAEGETRQRPSTRGSNRSGKGTRQVEEVEERVKTHESGRKLQSRNRSEYPPIYPSLPPVPQDPAPISPSQAGNLDQSSQVLPAPPLPELVEASTEEQPDDLPPETQLPISRPQTAGTWKTTSSQRRYIDELERLLIEERKVRNRQRRVLAESKLGEVGSN